jgi:hypothetical protein
MNSTLGESWRIKMRIMVNNKYGDCSILEINSIGMAEEYLYFSEERLSAEITSIYERTDFRMKIPSVELGQNILLKLLTDGYAKLDGTVEFYDKKRLQYKEI